MLEDMRGGFPPHPALRVTFPSRGRLERRSMKKRLTPRQAEALEMALMLIILILAIGLQKFRF